MQRFLKLKNLPLKLFISSNTRFIRRVSSSPAINELGLLDKSEKKLDTEPKHVLIRPLKQYLVDYALKYDPRLQSLSRASLDSFALMSPEEVVLLASQYLSMQHFDFNLKRYRVKTKNKIKLSKLQEAALFSAAMIAVEKRSVSLEFAARLLRPRYRLERFFKYRNFLAASIKSWTVEEILANRMTPKLSLKLLYAAKHFKRDARVIGSLAEKAMTEIKEMKSELLIRFLFCVSETRVNPPQLFWTAILRQLVSNMHKQGLKPRQCYRILEVCARNNISTDMNLLGQITEHCWKNIAINSGNANYPAHKELSFRKALLRLKRVADLSPRQFFRLIQISGSLGTNFNAGKGVITDSILIPLVWHLNNYYVSELLEALFVSRSSYPLIYQAIIDRVVDRGTNSSVCLLHVSKLLRCISRDGNLCSQLRLAKFFVLLEEVCKFKRVLRTIQMVRLIDDMYFITRRFSRNAPIVLRMQRIVNDFCGVMTETLKRGVASIDHINRVLEITMMMGMSNKNDYIGVNSLRLLRNEIYKNTPPGTFPISYRNKVPQKARFLYNEILFMNQTLVIFKQSLERHIIVHFYEQMVIAGSYNTIIAVNIYNSFHEKEMPLSSYLQSFIIRFLQFQLKNINPGDEIEKIALAAGTGKTFKSTDFKLFFDTAFSNILGSLCLHSFYLKFLEAGAFALNDADSLSKINAMNSKALF